MYTFFDRVKEKREKLSVKQEKIAKYIIKNYKTAVFLSSIELGKKADTSEATVVRLSNVLGYDGFSHMIKDIQEYIRSEITTLDRLNNFEKESRERTVFNKTCDNNIEVINNIYKTITQEQIDKVVNDITEHKRVVILGFESSGGIAEFIGYNLIRIVPRVEVITQNHSNILNAIKSTDENTFVITISFPRYSFNVIKIQKMLKKNNARILAITDGISSPVNRYSDYSIFITANNYLDLNSNVSVGVITLFQTIFMQYISSHMKDAKENLKLLEVFNKEYEVFYK